MKKNIVIIGCGFGGIEALRRLSRHNDRFHITVIDKRDTFDFLPLLPDIIGRDFPVEYLQVGIADECRRCQADFVHEEVIGLDPGNNTVSTAKNQFPYDQLIIACGGETNFYGNAELAQNAATLRSVRDGLDIKKTISEKTFEHFIIAGGGYTGIEIATQIKRWINRNGSRARVLIVERADSILGPLPDWIKDYTLRQIEQMDVPVLSGKTVQAYAGQTVTLSDNTRYPNALLIWVAGVKLPDFVTNLNVEKIGGRIKVNPFLQVRENVYAIGDGAAFLDHDKSLRMAVMFAMGQGKCAAGNIVRTYQNKPSRAYRALDLGYVIPVANNRASGFVLGMKTKGLLPALLHYGISAYRSYGWRNRIGVFLHSLRNR